MGVTLKDIARTLSISEAAASMALNNKPGVSEETRKAVKQLARETGYQPNKLARSLVARRSKAIGLVVPDIENPYYSKMVTCIGRYLHDIGYTLELATSCEDIVEERHIVKDFISKQVDGMIISPINRAPADLSHYDYIVKRELPAVFIASKYPGVPLPCVMVDLRKGSYNLMNYLLRQGRRKIKLLSGPRDVLAFSERILGCEEACRDNGIPWEPGDTIMCMRVNFEQSYFATLDILHSGESVDTIMTANDYMALGVLKALYENNIRVPDDIAVAGYDDIVYASISNIAITTVAQDVKALSHIAVDTVYSGIAQGAACKPGTTFVEPELILRASTNVRG